MIFVERPADVPASLTADASVKQMEAAELFYQTWTAGQAAYGDFTRYSGDDVKASLKEAFHWKCAYCETLVGKGAFEVEHYRPKGGVAGCDHPGYWWLALDWTNLLPACPGCNKGLLQHVVTANMTLEQAKALHLTKPVDLHGKATQFPVAGARLVAKSHDHAAEGPLLIDPTRTDPEPKLQWRFDCELSVVEPAAGLAGVSAEGEATIACVALNRMDLVQSRTGTLNWLKLQKIRILKEMDELGPAPSAVDLAVFSKLVRKLIGAMADAGKPDMPFAGMVRAFVRELTDEIVTLAAARGINLA